MNLDELRKKIDNKTARLCVIGLGYVGLPVAALFADYGFDVLGIELRPDRVETINAGRSPIEGDEPGLEELISRVIASGRLAASTDYDRVKDRDIILIDVETPVDELHVPHYTALIASLKSLAPRMKPGALIIVESTIAPGTMKKVVLPALEDGCGGKVNERFFLGNCPERVMPGRLLSNLREMSRVLGGGTSSTSFVMKQIYRYIVAADLDEVDWSTAELVKTVENAYRDVQIAFANEVALICESAEGDVWKVRELVNKSPYRQMHLPGAGVGGHCIPKDPWLLAYGVRGQGLDLKLIPAARAVNEGMPLHMVDLLKRSLEQTGRPLRDSRVLVLGYAYLENSDDVRNSPSQVLVEKLKAEGAQVIVHDPYVKEYQCDVFAVANGQDAVVVMVKHDLYPGLDLAKLKSLMRTPLIIDGRRVFTSAEAGKAGFTYVGIGQARLPRESI